MPLFDVQSTTIKDYAINDGLVYIFSASGVDIYRPSFIEWDHVGYAALADVTSGDVNNLGIWLGTAADGVYFVPFGFGTLTGSLQRYYAEYGTSYQIESNAINHVSGYGNELLITHAAGVDYIPVPGTRYSYFDAAGCLSCAMNASFLAYQVDALGFQTIALPTDDWVIGDTTPINTGTTPALSSNTVNHMMYGLDNNLVIATGSGVNIYDYTDITTFAAGNIPYCYATPITTQVAGDVAYIDSSDDAVIYDLDDMGIIETHTGTFTATWIDLNADLALYDNEVELHAAITNMSPPDRGKRVPIDWTLFFSINDTINGMSAVTVSIDGTPVTPTITANASAFSSAFSSAFGGNGFSVAFTPAADSAYDKAVTVEIVGTDSTGDTFTEIVKFTTDSIWLR